MTMEEFLTDFCEDLACFSSGGPLNLDERGTIRKVAEVLEAARECAKYPVDVVLTHRLQKAVEALEGEFKVSMIPERPDKLHMYLQKDPEDGRFWLAHLVEDDRCHTFGRTLKEAKERSADAASAWFDQPIREDEIMFVVQP